MSQIGFLEHGGTSSVTGIPISGNILELLLLGTYNSRGAFDSAKNHKRQRRKRQSETAKREKSQTPKFV